jgi:hypothetical protein
MTFKKTERDYKGMKLCTTCWDGYHYGYQYKRDKDGNIKTDKYGKAIHDRSKKYCKCKGLDGCQCPCRQLFEEEKAPKVRVKPDPTLQSKLFDQQQDGVGL